MARSPDHLTLAQFDLLDWISKGCPDGIYEGSSHRVSARGLHNRGLVHITGTGKTWTAKITAEGTRVLTEQGRRVAVVRERERQAEQAQAERVRAQQQLRTRALEVLEATIAAGGCLDLGTGSTAAEATQIADYLARERLAPHGRRLVHEPTRMDPDLGVAVYLEPDFVVLTPRRTVAVPRQLRNPHPAVAAFRDKRAFVSKAHIQRAARLLEAMVSAAVERGWTVPAKTPLSYSGRDTVQPDLAFRLPSQQVVVSIRELDQRGRVRPAFVEHTDYYTRTSRTLANKDFLSSGRLEVTLTKMWDQQPILSVKDTHDATLEDQLATLVHTLEVAEAQARWQQQEESRRAEIREVRWQEVKKDAFRKLTYARNAERLRDELARREAAAAMRTYADDIDAHAASLEPSQCQAAQDWASWIRRHADHTDPLHGPLQIVEVTTCRHEELQPYMNGWSTYHATRQ
ncbi:hypothetical protein CEJ39_01850 [Rhodococcus pyridinivorans]|nr:hypothetical protein CEJ39_01850 [Rhodococcus pyridinivorans]